MKMNKSELKELAKDLGMRLSFKQDNVGRAIIHLSKLGFAVTEFSNNMFNVIFPNEVSDHFKERFEERFPDWDIIEKIEKIRQNISNDDYVTYSRSATVNLLAMRVSSKYIFVAVGTETKGLVTIMPVTKGKLDEVLRLFNSKLAKKKKESMIAPTHTSILTGKKLNKKPVQTSILKSKRV